MNKREIIVYVSGKYSGNFKGKNPISKLLNYIQIIYNIWQARKLAVKVWEAGFTALTPHLNTCLFELDCKCGYKDYLNGDYRLVDNSDCMIMVKNWKKSEGANKERVRIKYYGRPVFESIKELKEYYK